MTTSSRDPFADNRAPERREASGRHIRTALFVDFDNIYSGLQNQDPTAAEKFANDPNTWVRWLQDEALAGDDGRERRAILLRRCYLNPKAFGRARASFVSAGFQVTDCPPLTSNSKNGADIQIVMDVLDALEHRTWFDEFVLFSGDSDFTPVLLRLRAHDRRTVILPIGFSASAYRAACDQIIQEETFIEALLGSSGTGAWAPPRISIDRRDVVDFIQQSLASAGSSISSATMAQKLSERYDGLRASNWAGTGGFKEFVLSLGEVEFAVSWSVPGYFYDPRRDTLPVRTEQVDTLGRVDPALAELARRIHEVIEVPLLPSATYALLFQTIAEEADANGYSLTGTSKAVRDRMTERSAPVARQDVSFVLKGITYSGKFLAQGPGANDPIQLADSFRRNVLNLCERAQLALTTDEVAKVNEWIQGSLAGILYQG